MSFRIQIQRKTAVLWPIAHYRTDKKAAGVPDQLTRAQHASPIVLAGWCAFLSQCGGLEGFVAELQGLYLCGSTQTKLGSRFAAEAGGIHKMCV